MGLCVRGGVGCARAVERQCATIGRSCWCVTRKAHLRSSSASREEKERKGERPFVSLCTRAVSKRTVLPAPPVLPALALVLRHGVVGSEALLPFAAAAAAGRGAAALLSCSLLRPLCVLCVSLCVCAQGCDKEQGSVLAVRRPRREMCVVARARTERRSAFLKEKRGRGLDWGGDVSKRRALCCGREGGVCTWEERRCAL